MVRWIYHSFLSGKGIASIAKDLESRKVPKLRGEPVWSKHGVLYILTNERYAGNELFRKSYRTDAIPFRKVDNRGEKSQFYAEATHEAIVPFQTFQLVQKLLQKRKEQFGKQQQGAFYPLSGKITCGLCGGTYYRRLTSQGTSWVCENHLASRCPAKGMGEKAILSTIQRFLHRLEEHRGLHSLPLPGAAGNSLAKGAVSPSQCTAVTTIHSGAPQSEPHPGPTSGPGVCGL